MERHDYRDLDTMFHSRIRLAVVSALVRAGEMDFTEIKTAIGATEGNLSSHLRRLEDTGYVSMKKGFAGRRPRTTYALTASGRKAFEEYVAVLATFIEKEEKE